jgi:hypothetical protein
MAHAHPSPSPAQTHRTRVFRILLGVVYLVALSGLILWEYREHLGVLSSGCEDISQEARSTLHSRVYERLLNWASGESASQVSIIAVPADLEDIQSNVCQARAYFADVVRTVATQHPAEVVLDKFYSPTSCANSPQTTQALLDAVRSLGVPVVVGENAAQADKKLDGTCLVRKPQMDFGAGNVRHGLTRLNREAEKIPLQWRILPSGDADAQPKADAAESLSLAAVDGYDADVAHRRRLQALIRSNGHPFANLSVEVPRETSTDLLCAAGTPAMQQRWSVSCSGPQQNIPLLGKVVVIGSEGGSDYHPVLDTNMWGTDLQARYIQVLLSGSYLRELPDWFAFVTFAAFVFVIEGMPTLLEAFRPRWKKHWFLSRAYEHRRYAWVTFWMLSFFVGITAVALALGYLPPLAVFGDISFVAITRLFFFAAESTGTPFLNPKRKGAS